jgi:hypothetical protein
MLQFLGTQTSLKTRVTCIRVKFQHKVSVNVGEIKSSYWGQAQLILGQYLEKFDQLLLTLCATFDLVMVQQ